MTYLRWMNKKVAVIAALIVTLLICIPVKAHDADTYICDEYQTYIYEVADEYGICPELIMAIIEAESSGKANVNNGNCIGLMQVSEVYHKDRMTELGVTDLYDPYSNILVGTDYFMELADEYEDLYLALAHYHGENNIDVNKPSKYVIKIVKRSECLERIHGK